MSIKKSIKQGPRFLPTSQAPLKEAHETLGGDAFDRGDLVARECKYDEKLGIYGEWKYIFENDLNESKSYQFNLKRGGLIKLERQVIPNEQLFQIRTEMEEEVKYNQYPFRAAFVEPRLHALYSNNPANGYMYHGVKMKSRPLAELHHISQLATTLADRFRTSEFNIGLDLVVYRNGKDSIGWHADNTQGEQIIASLLIDSPCPARTICIKPNNIPRDGDEAIELYPTSGDMYQMDAKMQEGYLHSIPRATTETKRRMVIVFRHGQPKKVDSDLGVQIKSLLPPTDRRVHYKFGTLSELTEGHLYSRQILLKTGAHWCV